MKFYHIILPILLAGCWCAQAQYTVKGIVSAPQNKPLDGVHIHIGQLHGISSPDGYYEIHNIPAGSQRIIVSYIGYKTLDTLVDIHANLRLDTTLQPDVTQLEEIVLAENNTISKSIVHEQRLKTETIEKYSNATLGDALKEIPGVYALKTGNAIVKPVINGLHSSRVPVIANNVRLEDQQWGTEHAPNLDINATGKISVIKGANALQYGGDAIGGLVLAEPAKILKDTLLGKSLLNLDSNGRGGSLSSSLQKGAEKGWAWNINGTFKYMGDRETPNYTLSNTGNRENNVAGNVEYIGNTFSLSTFYSYYNAVIGIAKATHIGNTSDLINAINNGKPNVIEPFTYNIDAPRQEIQHHLAKLNYNQTLTNDSFFNVQYAFQLNKREEYDMRRGEYRDIPALDLTLVTHSIQADWEQETEKAVFKAGLSSSLQRNEASPDTGVRPLIPNYDKIDAGAYGITSYIFSDGFSGEAGLRYDFSHVDAQKFYQKSRWNNLGYNGEFNHFITADYGSQWLTNPKFTYHNISASLGIRKRFTKNLELLGNAGLAMRNPNPSELFSDGLHHSNGTIELGNLRMNKEKALKFSATLLKSGNKFNFEINPYLNSVSDFIYLRPTDIEYTIRGSFPVYSYRQTNAILTGIDVHTNWKVTNNLSYTFNLGYVYGKNTSSDEPLIDMPPLNINNTVRYTFNNPGKLYIELRSEAIFTQARFPDTNFYADVPVNGELIPVLADVSTPPKGYHLLHFDSGMQFNLGKTQASVNFSAYNIFNTIYRDYLNRQRLYTDDIGRNFQIRIKLNY